MTMLVMIGLSVVVQSKWHPSFSLNGTLLPIRWTYPSLFGLIEGERKDTLYIWAASTQRLVVFQKTNLNSP